MKLLMNMNIITIGFCLLCNNIYITIIFTRIQVIPTFRTTWFVDHQQLKYNASEQVNKDCESTYWYLNKHKINEDDFFYEYLLMNQIPFPYENCHYSNKTTCSSFKKPKVSINKRL